MSHPCCRLPAASTLSSSTETLGQEQVCAEIHLSHSWEHLNLGLMKLWRLCLHWHLLAVAVPAQMELLPWAGLMAAVRGSGDAERRIKVAGEILEVLSLWQQKCGGELRRIWITRLPGNTREAGIYCSHLWTTWRKWNNPDRTDTCTIENSCLCCVQLMRGCSGGHRVCHHVAQQGGCGNTVFEGSASELGLQHLQDCRTSQRDPGGS